jgi:uncharacterized protein
VVVERLLEPEQCESLARLYAEPRIFRSRVVMARHGFGKGEYQYFSYPLPELLAGLRPVLYSKLVAIANRWHESLGKTERFPADHTRYLDECHAAGQLRPTPLLLRYGEGDYNCLHQDLYGERSFPLQVIVLLSEPGRDFTGGELVLTEQRPRMQSRVQVVSLRQGHGVSRLRSGHRYTAGIIFHDAT